MELKNGEAGGISLKGAARIYRFSLSRRLRDARAFRNIYSSGRHYVAGTMVLWVFCTKDKGHKVGVVASRRAFRRAVDRNRAKRRLRECIRCAFPEIKEGCNLILIARRAMLDAATVELEKDLRWLLRRAGVIDPVQ